MSKPSLALIPTAYKAGKLYSVLPENGSGDFDVSRNGTGTYIGEDGLIKTALANEPRFEYNFDGTFKGILVEPAATNLIIQSEDISQEPWVNTVSGTSTRERISSNIHTGFLGRVTTLTVNGGIRQSILVKSNTEHFLSFFIKGETCSEVRIVQENTPAYSGDFKNVFLNILTGEIISTIGLSSLSVIPYKGGFMVRFSLGVSRAESGASFNFEIRASNQSDLGKTFIVGLFQFKEGSVAASYIPTGASQVTRPADVIKRDNAQDLIGQTEGSVYMELDYNTVKIGGDKWITLISDGTLNNGIWLYISPSNTLTYVIRYNDVQAFSLQLSSYEFILGKYKILCIYKSGLSELYVNGVKEGSRTSTFTLSSNLSRIGLGISPFDGGQSGNHIKSFSTYKTALTESEAIALTTL